MQRCPVCNGRTVSSELGVRCMNAKCAGADQSGLDGVRCNCGEKMEYGGLNLYGDTVYYCTACGAKTKL